MIRRLWIAALLVMLPALPAVGAAPGEPAAPPATAGPVSPSPLVAELLADPITTESQRRALRLFHGRWNELTEPTPAEQARMALMASDLTHPVLNDPATDPVIRAEAMIDRGEPGKALEALAGVEGLGPAVLRAAALRDLGRGADAAAALSPWRERWRAHPPQTAADLTDTARAIVMLAEIEGRPAQDYGLAMECLGRARTSVDRLYWPAMLAEAQILYSRDNRPDAAEAAMQALSLNPKAGAAWHLLGRIWLDGFNFERAGQCVAQLRQVHAHHPLADALEARLLLRQRDAAGAMAVLSPALTRFPGHRELLALRAAAEALAFDDATMHKTLAAFDTLSPGSALAWHTVGEALAAARQYDAADRALRQAVAREPNWPEPRLELGLLLMQAGREEEAREALAAATRLDPFHRQAANQLQLLDDLRSYPTRRTEHFVIRHAPGIDAVLARDMEEQLEAMYRQVTSAFGHRPRRTTIIEIMPDERHFAVRITGMPDIWTIAASTGDVIALTPPRQGARQRGGYDWLTVVRHEFTHTVTLDQTDNRIPHWFTEACAVSQEPQGRDHDTCVMLAQALRTGALLPLDEIDWAFVRPRRPGDRALAYGQSHWMLEYITHAHGHHAVLGLLESFRKGRTTTQALSDLAGGDAATFMNGFTRWAGTQVRAWGLGPREGDDDPRVAALLRHAPPDDATTLASLLAQYPQHPDLLRLAAEQAVNSDDAEAARRAVMAYARARPTDPWADRHLARLALALGRPDEAMGAMESLDRQSTDSGVWAHQLAQAHQAAGRFDLAIDAMRRALRREPYNAAYRTMAATVALQAGSTEQALPHLRALTLLEPTQAAHHLRLAAAHHRLGQAAEARAAAGEALKLDPRAAVGDYLPQ